MPVLWIDGPPPFSIFLVFRVGRADETLAVSGITHLVEHLAFPHGHADEVGHNGTTELTRTTFYAWGDPSDAAQFIHRVSIGLSRPAVANIEAQKSIILTEEAGSAGGTVSELLLERYGPLGPGIVGYRQLGLHGIGAGHVEAWSSRFFTADNAIVCMTGPPPQRLALELPRGQRIPAPVARPIHGPLPRWSRQAHASVGLGVVTPHDSAAGTAVRMLERRLFKQLRHQLAISYSVDSVSGLIDGTAVHRAVVADTLSEAASSVADAVANASAEFAERGPSLDEMRESIALLERQLRDDPRAIAGWMMYAADCYLNGIDVEEFEDYIEARLALSRSDVQAAWQRAAATEILVVPPTVEVRNPRYGHRPPDTPLRGRTYRPPGVAGLRPGPRVVLASDGVSLLAPGAAPVTLRFEQCVALIHVAPDARILIDRDGRSLLIVGGEFAGGNELIARIDGAIHRQLWIWVPQRA